MPSTRGHWRNLANTIELVLPSAHPSPQPKRQINQFSHFGRPFIKRFALCYRTVARPDCLSVTLVYCGQTVGWIKMPIGTEVWASAKATLCYIGPSFPRQRGRDPNFQPMSVVAKQRLEVATPTRRAFSGHGGHALTWRSHGHSVAA